VLKSKRQLLLYSDNRVVRTYRIGLGFDPVNDKIKEGDGATPEGDFYIFTKNAKSSFHLSLGLSYPNAEDAKRGLREGLVTQAQHDQIVKAVRRKLAPPQNTPLGGQIYPVLPIKTFKTEDEALRLANDSPFGLTASVWTRDIKRGQRLAARIEAGTVTVNEVLYTHGIAQTPWGGFKQSGIGRTHGEMGLLELVRPQHIHTNRLASLHDLWWFNYTPSTLELFNGLARRFSSGSILQTMLLAPQMLRRLRAQRTKR
jgi:hypothetical protein